MTRHAELVREILKACNRLPGVFLFPVEVTVAQRGRVRRALGMTGTPDILGWKQRNSVCAHGTVEYAVPRFVAIEVKVAPDTLTPEQHAFLNKLNEAGGIAVVAYDVMTAVNALR